MSYETAPGTTLLATHCAICGRPLLDAKSVEYGMGPDCRKKHGFNEADSSCNWPAVMEELHELHPEIGPGAEPRQIANLCVHRIACNTKAPAVPAYINALRGLGFTRLANRLVERLCIVTIRVMDGVLAVKTPYSERAIDCFRRVPGRRWDSQNKVNTFPLNAKPELFRALQLAFPGEKAVGPEGIFTIPGRAA